MSLWRAIKSMLFHPLPVERQRSPAELRARRMERSAIAIKEQQESRPAPSRRQVDLLRNRLEAAKLKHEIALVESVTDSIYGTPVKFEEIYGYNGMPPMPFWMRELFQTKATTLRYQQEFDRARNMARYAFETNPNAQGVINGLCAYVVGGGYEVSATAKNEPDSPDEAKEYRAKIAGKVQRIIDQIIEVNELSQAKDGCPAYHEIFRRAHVEGEAFLRLYPDEWEVTRLRFVEADNFRPPAGEDWEGSWSFGVLTSATDAKGDRNIAWDTSDPIGYNINYPFINTDEQVPARFVYHLKLNVKKNQKRGISSLYSVDDDLRGTQKLRYAAREGEKVRQSIAYIREHEQADAGAVQSLQSGNITGTVDRTSQDGAEYQVNVQQMEPGTISDVPQGMKHAAPPTSGSAEALTRNLEAGLNSLAARFNAPSWLTSGASNDSSFAASLTAESPFLRTIVFQQSIQCGFWVSVFRACIDIEVARGSLPEDTLDIVHITVHAASPETRNKQEETNRHKTLHDEGVESLQEWSAQEGLDFDEQQAQITKERDDGIGLQKGLFGMEEHGNQVTNQGTNQDANQNSSQGPKTPDGERKKLEGNVAREQADGYIEAACAGYAIALAEVAQG